MDSDVKRVMDRYKQMRQRPIVLPDPLVLQARLAGVVKAHMVEVRSIVNPTPWDRFRRWFRSAL